MQTWQACLINLSVQHGNFLFDSTSQECLCLEYELGTQVQFSLSQHACPILYESVILNTTNLYKKIDQAYLHERLWVSFKHKMKRFYPDIGGDLQVWKMIYVQKI